MLAELAKSYGVVLLYHATFTNVPKRLEGGLHNVKPRELASQLDTLAAYFKFVEADEFARRFINGEDGAGLASVTFDDGYRCVFDEALPVFEQRNIPFAMYLNGRTLQGQTFWRDKVRAIVASDLEKAFTQAYPQFKNPKRKPFYRYTKHPANPSSEVEQAVDEFMRANGLKADANQWSLATDELLPQHPLITYGNHGYSHYVMSSLDQNAQQNEIAKTDEAFKHLPESKISRLFSLPFGGSEDYNDVTTRAVAKAGFSAMLMSRARLNSNRNSTPRDENNESRLPLIERFMPKSGNIVKQMLALVER